MAASSSREQVDKIHSSIDAVCRIVIRDEKHQVDDLGTGFLIGPNLLMTCNHLIPDLKTAQKAEAQFFKLSSELERLTPGIKIPFAFADVRFNSEPEIFFHSPQPPMKKDRTPYPADQSHLDYTIIALEPNSHLVERVHFSLFTARAPKPHEHHYVYQHPETPSREPRSGMEVKGSFGLGGGDVVKVSTYECHYTTPTAIGSSGSPVVGNDGNLIALHYQGVKKDERQKLPNSGVNMEAILNHLGKENLQKIKSFNEKCQASYRSFTSPAHQMLRASQVSPVFWLLAPTFCYLPEDVAIFIGRHEESRNFDDFCQNKRKVALSGLGGVGKTALALKHARNNTDYLWIKFIDSSNSGLLNTGLSQLADKLGIKKDMPKEKRFAELKVTLEDQRERSLLIFDGIDEEEVLNELKAYLPDQGNVLVLLTTRLGKPVEDINFLPFPLGLFTLEDAKNYLLTAVKTEEADREKQAEGLATDLEKLPLALTHAAAYIKSSKFTTTFGKYRDLFTIKGIELQSNFSLRRSKDTKTIFTTYNASVEAIKKKEDGVNSIKLIHFLAFLDHAPIPISLIQAWFEVSVSPCQDVLDRALGYLEDYSLIRETEKIYHIHKLVREVIRYDGQQKEKALYDQVDPSHIISVLSQAFDKLVQIDTDNFYKFTLTLSHALFLLKKFHIKPLPSGSSSSSPEPSKEVAQTVLKFLALVGNKIPDSVIWDWRLLAPWAPLAREAVEPLGLETSIDLGDLYYSLGRVAYVEENYSKASHYFEKALSIRENSTDYKRIANCEINLGLSYNKQGQIEEEIRLYKKTLRDLERATQEDVKSCIAVLNSNLGYVYLTQDKPELTIGYCQKALKLFDTIHGNYNHPDIFVCLTTKAKALLKAGDVKQAAKEIEQAYNSAQSFYKGEPHVIIAFALDCWGDVLHQSSNYPGAIEKYIACLKMHLKLYPNQNNSQTATILAKLGKSYQANGQQTEADKCSTRASEIEKACLRIKKRRAELSSSP